MSGEMPGKTASQLFVRGAACQAVLVDFIREKEKTLHNSSSAERTVRE
jgi:hypothetical protein